MHECLVCSRIVHRSLYFCFLLFLCLVCASCVPWTLQTPSVNQQFQLQPQPHAHLTYVAIGASDTYGTGTADPVHESWPADLSRKLGKGVRLINLGIPGIDTPTALRVELPVALDAHPDVVTIWLAVNDLVARVPVPTYQRDLETLLSRLRSAAPHARILVANVPNLALLPRFQHSNTQQLSQQIKLYNQAIATAVNATPRVVLIDLSQFSQTLTDHPEYISNDGLHPSAQGYAQLAAIFYQTMTA